MKACASCHKELPTPLDEFGKADAPLCRDCFLAGVDQPDYTRELRDAENYRDSILADLQDQHNLVEWMETRAADETTVSKDELARELKAERQQLETLKGRYQAACDNLRVIQSRPARKLEAWGGMR